jgi:hypothetical protein
VGQASWPVLPVRAEPAGRKSGKRSHIALDRLARTLTISAQCCPSTMPAATHGAPPHGSPAEHYTVSRDASPHTYRADPTCITARHTSRSHAMRHQTHAFTATRFCTASYTARPYVHHCQTHCTVSRDAPPHTCFHGHASARPYVLCATPIATHNYTGPQAGCVRVSVRSEQGRTCLVSVGVSPALSQVARPAVSAIESRDDSQEAGHGPALLEHCEGPFRHVEAAFGHSLRRDPLQDLR